MPQAPSPILKLPCSRGLRRILFVAATISFLMLWSAVCWANPCLRGIAGDGSQIACDAQERGGATDEMTPIAVSANRVYDNPLVLRGSPIWLGVEDKASRGSDARGMATGGMRFSWFEEGTGGTIPYLAFATVPAPSVTVCKEAGACGEEKEESGHRNMIPEPGTFFLVGTGLLVCATRRGRSTVLLRVIGIAES